MIGQSIYVNNIAGARGLLDWRDIAGSSVLMGAECDCNPFQRPARKVGPDCPWRTAQGLPSPIRLTPKNPRSANGKANGAALQMQLANEIKNWKTFIEAEDLRAQ